MVRQFHRRDRQCGRLVPAEAAGALANRVEGAGRAPAVSGAVAPAKGEAGAIRKTCGDMDGRMGRRRPTHEHSAACCMHQCTKGSQCNRHCVTAFM